MEELFYSDYYGFMHSESANFVDAAFDDYDISFIKKSFLLILKKFVEDDDGLILEHILKCLLDSLFVIIFKDDIFILRMILLLMFH